MKNKIQYIRQMPYLMVFLSFLLLMACSEQGTTENITQITQNGMDVIDDVSLLPPCSASNEGEMVWITNEATPRNCREGKWYAVAEGSVTATCFTEPLFDGSGVKIICGGDSIGVVYNGIDGAPGTPGNDGKDGEDGTDGTNGQDGSDGVDGVDGKGCSIEPIDDTSVRVICGDDSTILFTGSAESLAPQDSVILDSEKIAISLGEVSGVTQKGPFLAGATVSVREMEDGRTLTQTGNSFDGKILNDKGEFKINARMLVSQYVMLQARGHYRNEVTGENSGSELTLFAITDVNDRNIVNVNLLTHLEYERVVYLVTKQKMKVRAAKRQAQKEVFGLLNIDATGFSNSEDLNIAGASDEDGALLAFSLMFQGDRDVGELSELLTKIGVDMMEDGTWDDAKKRMEIADWCASADSAGRLSVIRNNVRNWGLSSVVPNFEQFVRNYWYTEYGLGICSEDSVGIVKSASAGKHKNSKVRYVCSAGGTWDVASDIAKDIYGWQDSTDGALKSGIVTGNIYVFDSLGIYGNAGWRLASDIEKENGGCRKEMFGEIRRDTKNGGFYQCQETSHRWALVNNNLLIDTQKWGASDDGYAKWGDSIGVVTNGSKICYVYDTSATYKGWRKGTNEDCTLGLMGCTQGRAGRMQLAENGSFYNCASNQWTKVTDRVSYNTEGWACLDSNDGELRLGLYNTDVYFTCDGNAWRESSTNEEIYCRENGLCNACTQNRRGAFLENESVQLICDDAVWRTPNCAELATKGLCLDNDSTVVWACEEDGNTKIDYICSNDSWHPINFPLEYGLEDWEKKKAEYYTAETHPDATYGEDLVDSRDGNVYKTVYINGLRWMAENLRYVDSNTTINLKGNIGCPSYDEGLNIFDYPVIDIKNCQIGGALYSWTAIMNIDKKWLDADASSLINAQHQGICPEGWHVPNDGEWYTLAKNNFSNESKYTNDLFAVGRNYGWNSYTTDKLGFSILPVLYDLRMGGDMIRALLGSSLQTSYQGYHGAFALMVDDGHGYEYMADSKYLPFSLRCVEDYEGLQIAHMYSLSKEDWAKRKAEYYTKENNPSVSYDEDLVDSRDGNVYKTVVINGKRWMAEDLRISDSIAEPWLKKAIFGTVLDCDTLQQCSYSYVTTDDIQLPEKLCPEGWHLPSESEFESLLEGNDIYSLQMKATSDFPLATDATGFSIVPIPYTDEYYAERIETKQFYLSGAKTVHVTPDNIEIKQTNPYNYSYIRCLED
ncbi:MAG: hypothetical protein J6A06_06730 [Fibrobacteraceae bacterium]|nr:hypothetical protein [Fibrobacteraceae bacterium]